MSEHGGGVDMAVSAQQELGPVSEHDDLESVYHARIKEPERRGLWAWLTATRARELRGACWAAALLAERHAADSCLQARVWARRARLAYEAYLRAASPDWVRMMFVLSGAPLLMDIAHHPDDPLYRAVQDVQGRWPEPPQWSAP